MSTGGRPPKTTAEHKRDGTFREDRHGGRGDNIEFAGTPQKPRGFGKDESWLWDLIVGGLPEAAQSQLDTPALIGLCRWWVIWKRYDEQLAEMPDVELSTGNAWKLVCGAGSAWKHFCGFAGRFGLSPSDRTKLQGLSAGNEDADPLDILKRSMN